MFNFQETNQSPSLCVIECQRVNSQTYVERHAKNAIWNNKEKWMSSFYLMASWTTRQAETWWEKTWRNIDSYSPGNPVKKKGGGVSFFFCFSLWRIFLFLPPFLFRRRKGVLFSAWHFDAVLNVNILQLIWRGVLCVVRHCVFYSRTNRIYCECFNDVILFNFDCFEFRIGRPASTWLFDQHVIKVMTIFLCGY